MRDAALPALAVVLLISAAGCSGLFPDQRSVGDNGRYDVPSTTSDDSTRTELAPGLTERGVSDPFALADSHGESLEGQSFSFLHELTIATRNGTILREEVVRGQVSSNRTRFRILRGVWRIDDPWSYDRYWSANHSGPVLRARERENSTEYLSYSNPAERPLRPRDILGHDPAFRNRLSRLLTMVDESGVETTNGSGYLLRVTNMTPSDVIGVSDGGPVTDVRMQFLIDTSGRVEMLYLQYNTTVRNRSLQVRERLRFTTGIEESIRRPAWTDVARSSIDGSVPGDRSRDSVGRPRVSGGRSEWGNGSDNETLSDPWPPRSPLGRTSADPAVTGTGIRVPVHGPLSRVRHDGY